MCLCILWYVVVELLQQPNSATLCFLFLTHSRFTNRGRSKGSWSPVVDISVLWYNSTLMTLHSFSGIVSVLSTRTIKIIFFAESFGDLVVVFGGVGTLGSRYSFFYINLANGVLCLPTYTTWPTWTRFLLSLVLLPGGLYCVVGLKKLLRHHSSSYSSVST